MNSERTSAARAGISGTEPTRTPVCVLDHHAPFVGVHAELREFLGDPSRLKQGCGIIWKFFALRIANARTVFKMKEILHYSWRLRSGLLPV
jgi:hypothetical protein